MSTAGEQERLTFDLPVTLPADGTGEAAFVPALWATRRIGELLERIDLDGENPELVEELVTLSTRYGILTPYTAFLAEEDVALDEVAENRASARRNLNMGLNVTGGALGVRQRAGNQALRQSDRAADSSAATSRAATSTARRLGRRRAGRGRARRRIWAAAGSAGSEQPPAPLRRRGGRRRASGELVDELTPTLAAPADARLTERAEQVFEEERYGRVTVLPDGTRVPAARVQRVAGRSLFFKNGRWEDSTLTEGQRAAEPTKIEQFSDAYFDLAKEAGDALAPLLALTEPTLVRIGDEAYLITPPEVEGGES